MTTWEAPTGGPSLRIGPAITFFVIQRALIVNFWNYCVNNVIHYSFIFKVKLRSYTNL